MNIWCFPVDFPSNPLSQVEAKASAQLLVLLDNHVSDGLPGFLWSETLMALGVAQTWMVFVRENPNLQWMISMGNCP